MSGWMSRFTSGTQSAPPTALGTPTTALTPAYAWPVQRPQKPRDPNTPDHRLQLNRKCIYERRLPGESYITVHCERLQSGFYDSPGIHEDSIENVRFVALNFVFHPSHTINRFKSARISVALHNQDAPQPPNPFDGLGSRVQTPDPEKQATSGRRRSSSRGPGLRARSRSRTRPPKPYPHEDAKISDGPKFLRHAPHLLYGAISPETLQWNFNLAGSLGVSQTPVSASLQPSGGVKSSYKIFEMMKIQGSVRSLRSWYGRDYDVEDGEIVWTLEENKLQKSGLPREFTFVMMVHKGAAENNVAFDVEIEPQVGSFVGGHFPKWYVNFLQYQPLHKELLDLDKELGQRFDPCTPGRGYNFANLESTFDDFVSMPGTTYSSSDRPPEFGAGPAPADAQQAGAAAQAGASAAGSGGQGKAQGPQGGGKGGGQGQPPAKAGSGSAPSTAPATSNDINVRVFIERGESQTPSPNQTRTGQREPSRQHSLRKQRSREGLKQYGEQQDTPTRDITESPEQIQPRRRRNSASGAVNSAISQAQALFNNTRSPPPGHRRSSSTAPDSLTATSRSPPIHYSPKPQRPISFNKLSSTRPEDDLHVTRTHSPARSPQPSFQRPLSRSPHTLPHLHTPATNATKPRSPLANEYEESFLKPARPISQLNRFPSADPKTWATAADDHEPLYSVITPNKEQDLLDQPYSEKSRQNHYRQPASSGSEMTMTHATPIHRDFAELSRMRSSTPKDFAAVQDLQHLMHSPPRQKAAATSPPRIPQQPHSPRRDEDTTPRQGMRGTAPAPPLGPIATSSRPTAAASTAPRPVPAPQAMFPSQLPGKITEESPAASATTNMLSSRETLERERAARALEGEHTSMHPSHGYQMPPQPQPQSQTQQHQFRRRVPLGSSENYDEGQGVRDSGYHSAQGATPPEGWSKDANFQVSPISDDYTRPPVPVAPPVEAPMPPKALVAPRKRNSVRSSYPSWRANGTIG